MGLHNSTSVFRYLHNSTTALFDQWNLTGTAVQHQTAPGERSDQAPHSQSKFAFFSKQANRKAQIMKQPRFMDWLINYKVNKQRHMDIYHASWQSAESRVSSSCVTLSPPCMFQQADYYHTEMMYPFITKIWKEHHPEPHADALEPEGDGHTTQTWQTGGLRRQAEDWQDLWSWGLQTSLFHLSDSDTAQHHVYDIKIPQRLSWLQTMATCKFDQEPDQCVVYSCNDHILVRS